MDLPNLKGGAGIPGLNRNDVYEKHQIPLPPLAVQQEIVAEIEGYQQIIDGARQVAEHYRPRIAIDPAWPVVPLGSIATQITDGTHKTPTYTDSGVPFLRVTDITNSDGSKKYISKEEHLEFIKRCKPERGDILYSKNGTIGVAKMVDWDYEFSIFVSLAMIKPDRTKINPAYLESLMNSPYIYQQAVAHSKSGTVTNLHLVEIKQFQIPLPDLATQRAIVAEIDEEQRLVAANRALIDRFTAKIQRTINRVWEG